MSKSPSLRTLAAIWAAKVAAWGLRVLGRGGTQVPGLIALRIQPKIIGAVAHPPRVVAVTGTNGKTSVSNMLAEALEAQGLTVASNRNGSNLAAGISACLISAVTLSGRARADIAVLELDERSGRLVLPGLDPDVLLCTNLTRDSIKRNAHPAYIAWILESELSERATLILNADDQVASSLGTEKNPRHHFSIDPMPGDGMVPHGAALDAMTCPSCDHLLEWDAWRFNHIGRFVCPNCGRRSPEASYRVRAIDRAAGTAKLSLMGETHTASLVNDNIVNIYNEIAVAAALDVLGVPRERIIAAFDDIAPPTTRFDQETVGNTRIVRQLTKGLVGVACSRAFEYLVSFPGRKSLVFTIDEWSERESDVENTAWIYDADYEYLADPEIEEIAIGGIRRYDHALRLAIAGVDPARITSYETEQEPAERVHLDDIDVVGNLHSVHNAEVTGNVTQRTLRERLRAQTGERNGTAA